MKKILSLALAAAMVAGMATTAFAYVNGAVVVNPSKDLEPTDFMPIGEYDADLASGYAVGIDTDYLYTYDSDYGFQVEVDSNDNAVNEINSYGTKYGVRIVFDSELSTTDKGRYDPEAEWELGESLVSDLQIEYLKNDETGAYEHFITFETESSTTTSKIDVVGMITVAKTRSDADDNYDNGDYIEVSGLAANSKIYYPAGDAPAGEAEFEGDLEDLEFFDGDVIFTVDTANQGTKLNLATSSSFQSDFAAMYPEANLDFYKWSATPSFNRTGELVFYVDAEQDLYFYEVTEDGAKETAAEYDEEYEAFVLRTRTLGNYVLSDMELDTEMADEPVEEDADAPTEEAPEDVKPNPGTGR